MHFFFLVLFVSNKLAHKTRLHSTQSWWWWWWNRRSGPSSNKTKKLERTHTLIGEMLSRVLYNTWNGHWSRSTQVIRRHISDRLHSGMLSLSFSSVQCPIPCHLSIDPSIHSSIHSFAQISFYVSIYPPQNNTREKKDRQEDPLELKEWTIAPVKVYI